MTTDLIEKPEQATCKHQWWNLIHVNCCMKCGENL